MREKWISSGQLFVLVCDVVNVIVLAFLDQFQEVFEVFHVALYDLPGDFGGLLGATRKRLVERSVNCIVRDRIGEQLAANLLIRLRSVGRDIFLGEKDSSRLLCSENVFCEGQELFDLVFGEITFVRFPALYAE